MTLPEELALDEIRDKLDKLIALVETLNRRMNTLHERLLD